MWSLKADGSFTPSGTATQDDAKIITFQDGCGFSEATLMRRECPKARIIANGELIPDQVRMAFQSGIDEIVLDDTQLARYSTEAWQQALSNSVTSLYAKRGVSRLKDSTPLWQR